MYNLFLVDRNPQKNNNLFNTKNNTTLFTSSIFDINLTF